MKHLLPFIGFILLMGCQETAPKPEKETVTEVKHFEWNTQLLSDSIQQSIGLDTLLQKVEKGYYGNIDELLITQADQILYQKKYAVDYKTISKGHRGEMGCGWESCDSAGLVHDYNYYHPDIHPYHRNNEYHTLQSITKSVTSTLIGCLIQEGKELDVDSSIYKYFEAYYTNENKAIQEHLKNTTLEDVLTMRLGLAWKELGYSLEDDNNVSVMEQTEDWVAYILAQQVAQESGEVWNYNSGASQLLSEIIAQTSDQTVEEYAQSSLFKALNITEFKWKKTAKGRNDTEGGLYLKAGDLGKIGLLYLNDGIWEDKRLLPEGWVQKSTAKTVQDIYGDGGGEGYGYQWWLTAEDNPVVVGLGYGGQILIIIPEKEIVAVVYSWNIFDEENAYIFKDLLDVLMTL